MHLKDIHIGRDTLSDLVIAAAALLGICAGVGVLALILRLASGKW
jgi:hypothetical protein